jgi:hypothetical protein
MALLENDPEKRRSTESNANHPTLVHPKQTLLDKADYFILIEFLNDFNDKFIYRMFS